MTTTKTTIALAELVENGAEADLLRDMIQYVAQRMMDMDVESLCQAAVCPENSCSLRQVVMMEPVGCEFLLRSTIAQEIRGLRCVARIVGCHPCALSSAS